MNDLETRAPISAAKAEMLTAAVSEGRGHRMVPELVDFLAARHKLPGA